MFDIFYIGKKPEVQLGVPLTSVLSEEEAMQLCTTRYCWLLHYLCDYSSFDFLWEPVPWERTYKHVWGSRWQQNSGTSLLPIGSYNGVKYQSTPLVPRGNESAVILIDHGNLETDVVIEQLEAKGLVIKKKARFISSYYGTLKRILALEKDELVWVCSSICNYSNFDFGWHPNEWQHLMLHVFPSNDQRFGDTFLINVSRFNERINATVLLEWYATLHFVDSVTVPRFQTETIRYDSADLVEVVKSQQIIAPYITLCPPEADIGDILITPNLWREETRKIDSLNKANSIVMIPRDAIQYIKDQCYDYPYISKKDNRLASNLQDVVFISNGEEIAAENWNILQTICPRAKHSSGITGRENAYKAAARMSDTRWFYAVFAKPEVLDSFEFSFQPYYLHFGP